MKITTEMDRKPTTGTGFWLTLREKESDIRLDVWHHKTETPDEIDKLSRTVTHLVNWYSNLPRFGKFIAAWFLGLPKYEIEATEDND